MSSFVSTKSLLRCFYQKKCLDYHETYIKLLLRPHLDYGDILYDKPNNENFQNKLEKVQYRACLAITGAI